MPKKSDVEVSVNEYDAFADPVISTGFDRGIDYLPMKDTLIKALNAVYDDYNTFIETPSCYKSKIRYCKNKLLYIITAMIQLRNGSRISEACNALVSFCKNGTDSLSTVKIAKSESIKYRGGEKTITKPRYRKMIFPKQWIKDIKEIFPIIKEHIKDLPISRLKKRVLDYLLLYHNCNTHSLRYACINYLIYEKERPLNDVAKFVGHIDLSMLTKYTQQKNCEKIFDLDM